MEKSQILKDLVFLLRDSNPDLQAVYLFGSVAKETSSPQSDIDIAILCPSPVDQIRLFDQQQKVSQILRQQVDLVDLGSVSQCSNFKSLPQENDFMLLTSICPNNLRIKFGNCI